MPVARKLWQPILVLMSGLLGPAADHPPDVGGAQRVAGQLGVGARCGAEEGAFGVGGDAGGFDVLVEILLQGMVGGHVVLLAAFLLEPEPASVCPEGNSPRRVMATTAPTRAKVKNMAAIRARSRRPIEVRRVRSPCPRALMPMTRVVGMLSRRSLVSSASSTGVLPLVTTCLGPRTAWAGLTSMTWPVTSQSKSMRMVASCCLTEGLAWVCWSCSM